MNSLNFPVQRGRLPPLDGNSSTHLRRHYPLLPRRGNNYLNFVLEIIFLVSCMLLELFSHLKSEPGKRWFPTGAMGFPCEWRSFPATILVPVHLVRDNLPKISLRRKFLRSVTPSLVAWMALLVPSQPAATTICVAGLITALVHFSLQQCINWNDLI